MVSVDEEDVPFSTIIYPADAKGMVSELQIRCFSTAAFWYSNIIATIRRRFYI